MRIEAGAVALETLARQVPGVYGVAIDASRTIKDLADAVAPFAERVASGHGSTRVAILTDNAAIRPGGDAVQQWAAARDALLGVDQVMASSLEGVPKTSTADTMRAIQTKVRDALTRMDHFEQGVVEPGKFLRLDVDQLGRVPYYDVAEQLGAVPRRLDAEARQFRDVARALAT